MISRIVRLVCWLDFEARPTFDLLSRNMCEINMVIHRLGYGGNAGCGNISSRYFATNLLGGFAHAFGCFIPRPHLDVAMIQSRRQEHHPRHPIRRYLPHWRTGLHCRLQHPHGAGKIVFINAPWKFLFERLLSSISFSSVEVCLRKCWNHKISF